MLTNCGKRYSTPGNERKNKFNCYQIEKVSSGNKTHHHHNIRDDIALFANHRGQVTDCERDVFTNRGLCFFFCGYNTIVFIVGFFIFLFRLNE